jgi:hypothetical protein
MLRIAEKLEFITGWEVKVCAKAGIGRKKGHKKGIFMHIFSKTASEKNFLGCSCLIW